MKIHASWLIAGAVLAGVEILLVPRITSAQAPRGPQPGPRQQAAGRGGSVDAEVARLMAYDKNGDGMLTRAELSDARLQALFDRADANKDGVVTREELTALLTKESASLGDAGPRGFGGPGGPGGRGFDGPPPGFQAGGPGGRGFGGPPAPGQVLPATLQDRLGLSEEQKRQLTELQKDVDSRLAKILTAEQRQQWEQMRQPRGFGPGGPGGPQGFGGPGGPEGPEGPGRFEGGRGPEGAGNRGPGSFGGAGRGTGAPVAATASAAEVYRQKCQGCHGVGGRGGRAPALTGLAGGEDDIRRIVQNGEGRMPGFSGSLTAAQITAVAKYALGLRK